MRRMVEKKREKEKRKRKRYDKIKR